MSVMPSPEDILARPDYYLHSVDLNAGECHFMKLSDDAYRRSSFMDHRLQAQSSEVAQASLAEMQRLVAQSRLDRRPEPIGYIFHTAFCCSTLISRCLDIDGRSRALREPAVLMQMANYKRTANPYYTDSGRWQQLLSMVLLLLAKPQVNGEVVIIKPTNAANLLANDIVRMPRSRGILLLYSSLDQFLISIIKKGEEGRRFIRKLFNVIRMDSDRSNALPVEALVPLTDLQIAAFVWYLQMDTYLKLLAEYPSAAVRTLNCDEFLAAPVATLARLCALLEIEATNEDLEKIVAGPNFTKNSKNDAQNYDASMRKTEYEVLGREHRSMLDKILAWSGNIRPEGPITLPLERSL